MIDINAIHVTRLLHLSFWLLLPFASLLLKLHTVWRERVATPAVSSLTLEVLSCHDGDTCSAEDSQRVVYTLRLAGIDAPEANQPPLEHAERASHRVRELAIGRKCRAELLGKDVYQRSLALLWCDGALVNEQLVREGLVYAYVNLRYRESAFAWAERAEREARRDRRGVHRGKGLRSPHRFRADKRKAPLRER